MRSHFLCTPSLIPEKEIPLCSWVDWPPETFGPLLDPRRSLIFPGIHGKVTCAPLSSCTCLDTIASFSIVPCAFSDTRSRHLFSGTPLPRIGSSSKSPLDLLTHVLESGISLKEPQALENHGRSPLLEGREAEGSRVSDFSADSTP